MKRTALMVLGTCDAYAASVASALHRLGAGELQASATAALARLNDSLAKGLDDDGGRAASYPQDALEAHSRAVHGKQAAALLQCRCGDAAMYVLHESRLARLLPFWLPVFSLTGHEARCAIIVDAPPLASPTRSDDDGNGDNAGALDPALARLVWLGRLLDAERDTRARRRALLTADAWSADVRAGIETLRQALDLVGAEPPADVVAAVARALPARVPAQASDGAETDMIQRWCRNAYNLVARGNLDVLAAYCDALRPDFDAVAQLQIVENRRCRAAMETEVQRLARFRRLYPSRQRDVVQGSFGGQ